MLYVHVLCVCGEVEEVFVVMTGQEWLVCAMVCETNCILSLLLTCHRTTHTYTCMHTYTHTYTYTHTHIYIHTHTQHTCTHTHTHAHTHTHTHTHHTQVEDCVSQLRPVNSGLALVSAPPTTGLRAWMEKHCTPVTHCATLTSTSGTMSIYQ